MQASLCDLSAQRNSPSFAICQRILHKCHEIIFADQVLPSNSPYTDFIYPAYTPREKVKHHVEPAFVGLGVLLAAAPAMPQLAEIMGYVAIEQGRRGEDDENIRSVETDDAGAVMSVTSQGSPDETDETESPTSLDDNPQVQPISTPPPQPGNLLSRRSTLGAQTLPALPLHLQDKHRSRLSQDPLGQLESQEVVLVPYQSSPSLPSSRTSSRATATQRAEALLEQVDPQFQMRLLRGNFYHTEVRRLWLYSSNDVETSRFNSCSTLRASAIDSLLSRNLPVYPHSELN
jgi:phosphatidylinositol 4-kinase